MEFQIGEIWNSKSWKFGDSTFGKAVFDLQIIRGVIPKIEPFQIGLVDFTIEFHPSDMDFTPKFQTIFHSKWDFKIDRNSILAGYDLGRSQLCTCRTHISKFKFWKIFIQKSGSKIQDQKSWKAFQENWIFRVQTEESEEKSGIFSVTKGNFTNEVVENPLSNRIMYFDPSITPSQK